MPNDNAWIGWAISGVILAIIGWVNIVSPLVRRYRLRAPFTAYFRPEDPESGEKLKEWTVPPHSEVQIQINRYIHINHREFSLTMGFDGDERTRPQIVRLENKMIVRGKAKSGSPETNENHAITDKGRYYVKGEEYRAIGHVAPVGIVVQTGAPGRYPMYLRTGTEAGAGQSKEPLTLIVK